MLELVSPALFKSIPWKNGKGTTLELAINPGGTLQRFEWRVSIASVLEDGEFSDFSGYQRHLVLLEGQGIDLNHANGTKDSLKRPLSIATFDGGVATVGKLHDGPVKDFNLMVDMTQWRAQLQTFDQAFSLTFPATSFTLIYAVDTDCQLQRLQQGETHVLPMGHLAILKTESNTPLRLSGNRCVLMKLTPARVQ